MQTPASARLLTTFTEVTRAPLRSKYHLATRRAAKKKFRSPAPSLLSLPEGEKIEEGSKLLCRVLQANNAATARKLLFAHPARVTERNLTCAPSDRRGRLRPPLAHRGDELPPFLQQALAFLARGGHLAQRLENVFGTKIEAAVKLFHR